MSRQTQRQLNRGAIYSALLIWLAVLFTEWLTTLGISASAMGTLLVAGLIAFPVLVLWPLRNERFFQIVDDESKPSLDERHHTIIVSFEIIALSALLISLLVHL